MGQSGSQTAIFYREVAKSGRVWTIKDNDGYPAPMNRSGVRSMPFWSSQSRAAIIIKKVPAYSKFTSIELNLSEFRSWLQKLQGENQLAGINWSGPKAKGYDLSPEKILKWLEIIEKPKQTFWSRLFKK